MKRLSVSERFDISYVKGVERVDRTNKESENKVTDSKLQDKE